MNGDAGSAQALRRGACNLLRESVGVKPGEHVLLVEEPHTQRFYCPSVANALASEAQVLGARVSRHRIDAGLRAGQLPESLATAMTSTDHAVLLTRLSDYARFMPRAASGSRRGSRTQCYALDAAMLASPLCTVPHALMAELLRRIEAALQAARTWRVTCELGTDIRGTFCWPSQRGAADDDFTVSLFPVMTFKPVPCDTASGEVVLSRWLMPGGEPKVAASTVAFDDPVHVTVSDGRLTAIRGEGAGARAVKQYYHRVEAALGVRGDRVHSWHAGINPCTRYDAPAGDDVERWGAIAFGSPRYLHFHTFGEAPPGEIAWSIFNPTVYVDGEALWRDGQFAWLARADNQALIARYPAAEELLAPSAGIGL